MAMFRSTSRERYARAVRHMMDHPEIYHIRGRGRDYDADIVNRATGCAWYVWYDRLDLLDITPLERAGLNVSEELVHLIADVCDKLVARAKAVGLI